MVKIKTINIYPNLSLTDVVGTLLENLNTIENN